MRNYIRTIADMEKLYYSDAGVEIVQKTDAPILSTTTGVYYPIYGAQVWSQLNLEHNMFGAVPKGVWGRSGWRVETARPAASGGGVAENGAIPDSIMPTWAVQTTKPKTVAHVFNISEVQSFLANTSADDAIPTMQEMRNRLALHHKEMMNVMLLTDVETPASNNVESVDRVCSSYSESALLSAATDSDLYGDTLRSSSASWKDAHVDHNSGVDRDLTDTLIRSLYRNVETNGGVPQFFFTGHDTASSIIALYSPANRYNVLGSAQVRAGVNGVQSAAGINVGFKVSTVYGWPLLISKNVVVDTISRLYLLDTSNPENFDGERLHMGVAKPTQYFEAGMASGDPFGINKLADEGMFRTMLELRCRFFKAQGKLRDLQ